MFESGRINNTAGIDTKTVETFVIENIKKFSSNT